MAIKPYIIILEHTQHEKCPYSEFKTPNIDKFYAVTKEIDKIIPTSMSLTFSGNSLQMLYKIDVLKIAQISVENIFILFMFYFILTEM